MNTVKKLALIFGVATGAAVTLMALSKSGKKTRSLFFKKDSDNLSKKSLKGDDDSDVNYV